MHGDRDSSEEEEDNSDAEREVREGFIEDEMNDDSAEAGVDSAEKKKKKKKKKKRALGLLCASNYLLPPFSP